MTTDLMLWWIWETMTAAGSLVTPPGGLPLPPWWGLVTPALQSRSDPDLGRSGIAILQRLWLRGSGWSNWGQQCEMQTMACSKGVRCAVIAAGHGRSLFLWPCVIL